MNKLPLFQKGHQGVIDFNSGAKNDSFGFLLAYIFLGAIFFLILIVRLFQLTIVKGVYYRDLSEQNRLREIVIEPQRGSILDRKGFVIAENQEVVVASGEGRVTSRRLYSQPEAFSPVVGYRQVADINDFKNDNCINKLQSGDKIGKKGIEKLYECELRGTYGKKLIEIDARGNYKNTLTVVQPKQGSSISLSIDGQLQQKAYELIQGKRAVVVGLKPNTGEVLILSSSPSYNPQVFEDGDSKKSAAIFNDPTKPLFNRATEGAYPPGSIFKLVVASGALEEKAITPDTLIEDTGVITAGTLKFHNWAYTKSGKTDGMVDLHKALQRSNDIYFYQVGAKLGPEKIKEWAEKFGFQNKTGIGIEETDGIIPSPFWKEDTLKDKWFLGDTYNLSIGQGYVNVTPLQVALETSVFANDGYLCPPTLLKSKGGTVTSRCKRLPIAQKTLEVVKDGMKAACETGGTGWPLFDFKVKDNEAITEGPTASLSATIQYKPITLGCKTGTAESHVASQIPHAWFTVYAPFENPEIILTVLVEEAGEGSDVAAPIAKELLKAYFERSE